MQGIDQTLNAGWLVCFQTIREPYDHATSKKDGQIVVPDHGSSEVGIGLQNKILKDAGLKQ
jgi:predicted RNA binding protein YcfA (HicA-like mRNA interferase family)